ncbi:hypothetical protein FA10DRAFT_264483 [Acaromyces ingoldii]|uniref:Uncharacterized protein n=1 Tax=Acaromyces ingoldii TaxID=215250 RepID=A0A316Z145_9BASI|nr:hypothetical protein FA10DRAFT_264483 [Acaromyces ingoldii]PWN93885.1 hypothetical protein FA10DRAFT_264483 [Acaromyces ingoldii]
MGKTHFKLAPGLVQPPTSPRQPRTPSTSTPWYLSSVDEAREHTEAADVYHRHWRSWVNGGSKAAATATATAAGTSSSFDEVPRDATLPIMSRLPLRPGEIDDIAANPTGGLDLDYLRVDDDSEVPGTHTERAVASEKGLTYTRARLPVLDEEGVNLWRSLHALRPLSEDYADGYGQQETKSKAARSIAPHPISADMDEAQCPAFADSSSASSAQALALVRRMFNWSSLPQLPLDDEHTFYGVCFRSKRRHGSENTTFYEDDRRAHEEAVDAGGLLMYWYGRPNATTGHNLAMCIWTSRQDALQASSLPLHARAAAHSRKAYESFELHRFAVRKVRGESKLRLEEWLE